MQKLIHNKYKIKTTSATTLRMSGFITSLKMKIFLIFLTVASVVFCDHSMRESITEDMIHQIEGFVKESELFINTTEKVKKICPDLNTKFERALKEVVKCDDRINKSADTMCQIIRKFGKVCLTPVTKVFEECLPGDSKTLPAFLVDSLVSIFDYICRINGEHIIELFNKCAQNSKVKFQCDEVMTKAIKVELEITRDPPKLPSKSELCDILTTARPCYKNFFEASCLNHKTRNALMGLYEATAAPCP